jgi:Polysaccharide biosynthesis enzyme WcbI
MKVFFLGNCQINAMRGLCRDMFPAIKASFQTITPYWGDFNEALVREELAGADLVVSQAIANPTTTFNVTDVRASTAGRVVFLPYIYVDGIASLEIIGSKGRSVIKGADQLLRGQDGRKPAQVFEDYARGLIDMENKARVTLSLARMAEKEAADCDLTISDYIRDTYRHEPALFGINHPTQHIVFELFRRLCDKVDWKYDPAITRDPVVLGKRALPQAQRAFTPVDVDALSLRYGPDTHWYGQAFKLLALALKNNQRQLAAE